MYREAAIDLSDIPEISPEMKARRNPYYERIMKHGFSVTEHYSPKDAAGIIEELCKKKIDILEMDSEEQAAFERYKKAHGYD